MKQCLKEIFLGGLYAILTLSLILSPIPMSGNALANDASANGVYKPSGELTGVIRKAQFTNYTQHQSSFMAILEQAVAGMMAVVLLQSLRYKYLHEEKPELYGNDCSANTAGSWTLRIAQLGALSYLLGDIKANMDFQKASKKAADVAFAPGVPVVLSNDMDEETVKALKEEHEKNKHDQLKTFDTLVEVLEAQKKGLQAKISLATLAEAAYLASTALELVGMVQCNAACATNLGIHTAKFATFEGLMGTAIAAATAEAATVYGSACSPAVPALGAFQTAVSGTVAGSEANDQAIAAAQAAKKFKEEAHWAVKVFAKVKSFFGGSDDGPEEAVSEAAQEQGAIAAEQVVGAAVEAVDDAEQAAKAAKDTTQLAARTTADGTSLATVVAAATACTASRVAIGEALNAYIDYAYTPVECCGGAALNTPVQAELMAAREALVATASSLSPTAQATEKAKQAAELGAREGGKEAMEKAVQEATKKAVAKFGSFDGLSMDDLAGMEVNLTSGTLPGYGLPKASQFNDTKDLRVLGLFEGLFGANEQQEALDDLKYYVKANFESLLRRLAINAQLERFDGTNPKEELAQIADLEQQMNHIMFFFDRMVDETITAKNADNLAFSDFKESQWWPTILNMVGNMVFPEAHANFLVSMGGNMVASMGLKMLQEKLGTKGPWGAILNVGSQFMMMSGILGKYAKSWGFVKPKGRAFTWGAMAAVNLAVLSLDNKAKDQVEKYIEATKAEKQRYLESAGIGGVTGENENKGILKFREGEKGGVRLAMDEANIKSCAVPKGDGFAPAVCPTKVPESTFRTPKLDKEVTKNLTPSHVQALGIVSDYSSGLATGSKGVDDLAGMDVGAVQKMNQAMRSHNEKLLKKVDQIDGELNRGKESKTTPLSSLLAQAKRGIISSANRNALASLNPSSFGAPVAVSKEEEKEAGQEGPRFSKSAVYQDTPGGKKKDNNAGLFDFDFGEDDTAGMAEVAARPEGSLEDFVIKHDDINKRKDVSIFKILSNRYLLSYPKILEEQSER